MWACENDFAKSEILIKFDSLISNGCFCSRKLLLLLRGGDVSYNAFASEWNIQILIIYTLHVLSLDQL